MQELSEWAVQAASRAVTEVDLRRLEAVAVVGCLKARVNPASTLIIYIVCDIVALWDRDVV